MNGFFLSLLLVALADDGEHVLLLPSWCNDDEDDLWVSGCCELAPLKAMSRGSMIFVVDLTPDVDGSEATDEIDGLGTDDGVLLF